MRSMLFAGATRPDLVAKLDRSGPDAVVIDLEDAVPAESKLEARAALRELIGTVSGPKLFVRVNAPDTSWFADDIVAVSSLPITGVVVPKVEAVDDLALARAALGKRAELVAGIESARGVANVEAILAETAPAAAYFGAEDYIADLGGRRSAGGEEALYARSRVALAARLAGVAALDQVVVDFRDEGAFRRDAEAGRAIGYRGKLCIHPSQVAIANEVFGASAAEVERARALLAAWEEGAARGFAAVEFEGAMIDGPALRMARDTIERGAGA
ncbi:MAG TPA: CoA ester lyase [Solirubrobacterales bacterium]|nr:CoA ester lyase [Solirubrobacterales bacterium]